MLESGELEGNLWVNENRSACCLSRFAISVIRIDFRIIVVTSTSPPNVTAVAKCVPVVGWISVWHVDLKKKEETYPNHEEIFDIDPLPAQKLE